MTVAQNTNLKLIIILPSRLAARGDRASSYGSVPPDRLDLGQHVVGLRELGAEIDLAGRTIGPEYPFDHTPDAALSHVSCHSFGFRLGIGAW
jgi:hypothetical protein